MFSTDSGLVDIPSLIARELDLTVDDLQDEDVEFSELGVDEISAPVIVNKINRALGLSLKDNVFHTFRTIGEFRSHIISTGASEKKIQPEAPAGPDKPLSILIRGNPANASRKIFLLPDGSGSAMAYALLTAPSPEFCLYAMNSPFLEDAGRYTCSIEDLSIMWAQEIQRLQPHGPYLLGGWSAGGYYTFEVIKYLESRGEVVDKVVLIDSPCRTNFEALPQDVILYLSSNNLMGSGGQPNAPGWLVDHFDATLHAVTKYKPTELVSQFPPPKVYLIWASDGLLSRSGAKLTGLDLEVNVTRFLLEKREDYGSHGWEKLFPESVIEIATMPGNHFNLVHQPNVTTDPFMFLKEQSFG